MRMFTIGVSLAVPLFLTGSTSSALAKGGGYNYLMRVKEYNESRNRCVVTVPISQSNLSGNLRTVSYEERSSGKPRTPSAGEPSLALKPGEAAVVSRSDSRLMVGSEVVGSVAKGTRVVVQQLSGDWAWTSVETSVGKFSGWLSIDDLGPDTKSLAVK